MSTRPIHDAAAIAQDGLRLCDVAKEDQSDKTFAAHVGKAELATLAANIAALDQAVGGRTTTLSAQIAAGAHTAQVRARIAEVCRAVHAAADLAFEKDTELRRAFGMGMLLDDSSTSSVELYGHTLLAAAVTHPKEAAKCHLDAKGIHHLEELLHALEGADVAHVRARANRHEGTTGVDSLSHLVAAEVAHIRFVARRVFMGNEAKLARYASTLPRHQVKHRTRLAPTPG